MRACSISRSRPAAPHSTPTSGSSLLVFRLLLISPLTVVVPLWAPGCVTVNYGSNWCSLAPLCAPCFLLHVVLFVIPTFPKPLCLPSGLPLLPRVRDWSIVLPSQSAWHQSVLAHVSCPLSDFPACGLSLLTQILPPTHKGTSWCAPLLLVVVLGMTFVWVT